MNFKSYKISESYQNNKPVPFIRLKGKWLEELNFNIGEDIREFSKINLTIWQNKNNDLNLLINRKIQGRSLLIWV